ncbi:hypothetical protein [Niveibacterium sp. SC-1]|uniref:hypothetical protein n=1 Tax=Niveibacterium sp. SC-1 TaxID=3135646 RepID=UPI003120517C
MSPAELEEYRAFNADSPLEIRRIYVRESALWMAPGFDPTMPGQHLQGSFRSYDGRVDCRLMELSDGSQVRSCLFLARFEFRYTEVPPGVNTLSLDAALVAPAVAEVSATIAADYACLRSEFPSMAVLQEYGRTNGMVHMWPYWREYCQNALMRMVLPHTTMPLLNLRRKEEAERSAAQGAAAEAKPPRKRKTPKARA